MNDLDERQYIERVEKENAAINKIVREFVRPLREITRDEWVVWHWENVQQMGEVEPVYLRGRMRTIDEAYQAGIEFDAVRPSFFKVFNNDEQSTGE